MKFLSLVAVAATLGGAQAIARRGFNLGAQNPDGSCKTPADWDKDFATMQSLPGGFPEARLFAASDCGALANAVQPAINHGVKLLVGVWTQDDAHYAAEKAALLAAINAHGKDWVRAISVGSEDLYRKEVPASSIASKVNEVRQLLVGTPGQGLWVGHVDTWTAWVDPANSDVIKACDFIGTDGYPYYQDSSIDNAYNVFMSSVQATKDMVANVSPGKPVWVTETGWPTSGATMGAAVPSVANLQQYWKVAACAAFTQQNTYWFQLRDVGANPSFGVVDVNYNPIIDLTC